MDSEAIQGLFEQTINESPQKSEAVSAIQTLIEFIKLNRAETVQELSGNLKHAIKVVKSTDHALVASIASGCELFLRFITLTALDSPDFQECKAKMINRGELFLQKVATSRHKIAGLASPFISDRATILTHARSRVVLQVLKEASLSKKRFTVYVSESKPDGAGQKMYNDLMELGIPTIVILDSAVGYVMEKVDMVLVGAEGVVESGGIINKIGTFTMSICAKEMNKPFYVVAESFKFTRQFPLNQQDIPNSFKYQASKITANADLSREHPMVDYTPPSYITLLFTDLGILTPSAVSDELIKLYL